MIILETKIYIYIFFKFNISLNAGDSWLVVTFIDQLINEKFRAKIKNGNLYICIIFNFIFMLKLRRKFWEKKKILIYLAFEVWFQTFNWTPAEMITHESDSLEEHIDIILSVSPSSRLHKYFSPSADLTIEKINN